MNTHLIKKTALVGSLTLISRTLGFIRDMLIARIFGVDAATDAFFVAFKIPNLLRRLFAEGSFAHAFIPVLSEYKQQNNPVLLKDFVDKMASTLLVLLSALTLIGIIIAPFLILCLAPGFSWQSEQHELAVELLRITLPYLLFVTMVAFSGAILNAHDHFGLPALTPVILNLCMIAAAVWLAPKMNIPVTALAWGVLAAGCVQLAFQIPTLVKLRLAPRFRLGFQDPGVKKVLIIMGPALLSVSATQINLLVDTLIASFLASGSVSWLYYSDRLVEFPLGLLGIAVATVILPNLSKSFASADTSAFSTSLDWSLRLVILIGLPATLGLILLAEPMISTLFQYNEFSAVDVHYAGQSLRAYAFGLLGFIMTKVLVPGFTARQDMKTPLRFGVYAMLTSLTLNVILVFPLAHAGLALATSLGAMLNASLLFFKLLRDNIYRPSVGWWSFILRVCFASATMSSALYFGVDAELWNHWQTSDRVLQLLKWIVIGFGLYGTSLLLTGIRKTP